MIDATIGSPVDAIKMEYALRREAGCRDLQTVDARARSPNGIGETVSIVQLSVHWSNSDGMTGIKRIAICGNEGPFALTATALTKHVQTRRPQAFWRRRRTCAALVLVLARYSRDSVIRNSESRWICRFGIGIRRSQLVELLSPFCHFIDLIRSLVKVDQSANGQGDDICAAINGNLLLIDF